MEPRFKIYNIILSPLIRFFHNTLHLSFFWPLLFVMLLLTIPIFRAPEWKLKKQNNLIEQIVVVIVRTMMILLCFLCLYVAVSEQLKKPFQSEGYFSPEFNNDEDASKKIFMLYFFTSIFGAYRVFRNGILLQYKNKKAGDKKVKIDIMSVVYFVMLSVFAITSLFIVLGVIKT